METSSPGDIPTPLLERAAAKLRTALALYESGVALKRAQLRRQNSSASDAEISQRLTEWLRTRPGAIHGDAAGEPKQRSDR